MTHFFLLFADPMARDCLMRTFLAAALISLSSGQQIAVGYIQACLVTTNRYVVAGEPFIPVLVAERYSALVLATLRRMQH